MKTSQIASSVLILSAAALLLVQACGGSSGREDWLVIAGEDTLFVDDARVQWEGIRLVARQMFLESPDPRELLVVTMARKALISNEIREQGIPSEPGMVAFRELWIAAECEIVFRGAQTSLEKESITEEDIRFYTDYYGYRICYTENPGSDDEAALGPVLLVHHKYFSVARQLAEMEPGDVVAGPEGVVMYRFDSLEPPDSVSRAAPTTDSTALQEQALLFISNQKARDWYLELQESLPETCDLQIDTSLVVKLAGHYSGTESIDFSSVIFTSTLGDWTVIDLMRAVSFINTRAQRNPRLESSIYYVINSVLMHSYFRNAIAENNPAQFDSLQAEADNYVMSLAVDTLYSREVLNRVLVRSGDIEDEFNMQDPPAVTQELRVFRTAVVAPAMMPGLENSADIGAFLVEMPGYSELARQGADSCVTRPLSVFAVPGEIGEELFQLSAEDTLSWNGPSSIPGSEEKIFWQLIEVIPSRFATVEELTPHLEQSAFMRLTEERVDQWVMELEEKHGLLINTALIETLPEDPGVWYSDSL